MTLRPCLTCGTPSDGPRCDDHTVDTKVDARTRGYGTSWDKLSRRARRLQPWCTDCGSTERLELDHLPTAWQRQAAGKPLRLGIDTEVVCNVCNVRRGSSRPGATRGDAPGHRHQDPRPSPDFPLSARGRPL